MKTLTISDSEVKRLFELISQNENLYKIDNWSINDLDAFREIGTEFISILQKYLND